MKRVFIIFTILIISGCSKDSDEEYDIANKINANSVFEPLLEKFKFEGEKRGYDFRNIQIEFYFADIDDEKAVALGNYTTKEIVVDRDYWNSINSNSKAFLIFHELGHAALNRKHTNIQTDNGECLSFMRELTNSDKCNLNYHSELWKEIYFNELFELDIALPSWYRDNKTYNHTYQNKDYVIETSNVNESYQINIDTDSIPNFVFEVTFRNWRSTSVNNPYRNTKINLNGINFESNPNRNNVFIFNDDYSKKYFSKEDYVYQQDIKLTIRKNERVYSFFIDESLVHVTDILELESQVINVDFSSDVIKDIVLFRF